MQIQSLRYKGPRRPSVLVVWVFALLPSVLCDLCILGTWLGRVRRPDAMPAVYDWWINGSAIWLMLLLPPTILGFLLATVYVLLLLPASSVPRRIRFEVAIVFAVAVVLFFGLLTAINPIEAQGHH